MAQRDVPVVGIVTSWSPDTFAKPIVHGAALTAERAGARVICFGANFYDPEGRYANPALDVIGPELIDGLVVIGGALFGEAVGPAQFVERHRTLPMVNISANMPNVVNVLTDNEGGTRDAVRHLASLGRRRIGFVSGPRHNFEAHERYQGYLRGLKESGLELDPTLIAPGAYVALSGEKAVELLIDERGKSPDAIVAANDDSAIGALNALRRRGLRVPEDVALIGFDDVEEAAVADPPLTSMAQPLFDLGAEAVKCLLAKLEGEQVEPEIRLPTELIIRQSCGASRVTLPLPALTPRSDGERLEVWLARQLDAIWTFVQTRARLRTSERPLFERLLRDLGHVLDVGNLETSRTSLRLFDQVAEVRAPSRFELCLHGLEGVLWPALEPAERDCCAAWTESASAQIGTRVDTIASRRQISERRQTKQLTEDLGRALAESRDLEGVADIVEDVLSRSGFLGYHLALRESDPAWSRLLATSAPKSAELPAGIRFRTGQLIPDLARRSNTGKATHVIGLGFGKRSLGLLTIEAPLDNGPSHHTIAEELTGALERLVPFEGAGDRTSPTGDRTHGVPSRIGRYKILARIGVGGMATVFLGQTEVAGVPRPVAIKVLQPGLQGEEWAAQLIEEAKLAAAIRHPNIVQVLELGEHRSGVFIAMEFIEGGSLASVLTACKERKEKVPLGIAGRMLADALSGLHAAHELLDGDGVPLNLVHRDVSLTNIMVGADGITRLTDFGIAKTARDTDQTASGVLKGKVRYMSPEQAMGRSLDRRSDLWAMGVVAWELIANRRLYQDDTDAAALLHIVTHPPPRLSSVCDIPPGIDDVMARALQMEPAERFQTARDFRAALVAAWDATRLADPEEVGTFIRATLEPRSLASYGDAQRTSTGSVSGSREADKLAPKAGKEGQVGSE